MYRQSVRQLRGIPTAPDAKHDETLHYIYIHMYKYSVGKWKRRKVSSSSDRMLNIFFTAHPHEKYIEITISLRIYTHIYKYKKNIAIQRGEKLWYLNFEMRLLGASVSSGSVLLRGRAYVYL